MRGQTAPGHAIARVAARQGGVIAHGQLRRVGLSPQAIERRIRTGGLHPLHRGVFAVGHGLTGVDGRRWAAVLALGDEAFLSHGSAADAFGIRVTSSGLIHMTVRGRGGRERRPGIRVHRPLEAALDEAERRKLVDFAELHALLAHYPRRAGARSLKAQLARYRGPADTRSKLERLVNELCDDHGLPRPLVNTVIDGEGARLLLAALPARRRGSWPHLGRVNLTTRVQPAPRLRRFNSRPR